MVLFGCLHWFFLFTCLLELFWVVFCALSAWWVGIICRWLWVRCFSEFERRVRGLRGGLDAMDFLGLRVMTFPV